MCHPNLRISVYTWFRFLVFFFFFFNYLLLSCATSVRPSVRLSSVEIIFFCGNLLSNRPIDLKICLNVREGVVYVRKAWFFKIRIASGKFFAIYVAIHADYKKYCRISRQLSFVFQLILQLVAKRIVHSEQQVKQYNPREIRFLYTMITMQCTLFFNQTFLMK